MFFVIDSSAATPRPGEDRLWQHLWELRDLVPVSVLLPTVVSSPCPLLAEESTAAILRSNGMPVPRNTAWVPLPVDVSRFANRRGNVNLQALETTLRDCVDRGEALHDSNGWTSEALRYDSWLNRRLAVSVRGWGDLVNLRGADPGAFRTLAELEELADFIGTTLLARSQSLAREKGHCPALELAGARMHGSSNEMRARWQQAVDDTALRHRNLTTMSPWDVFPRDRPADFRYVDLLPIVRCANSLSFQREVDIAHWNVNEFRSFYERLSAVLRCSLDALCIAKQV